MGSTTQGLPWPEPTEPVAGTDDAIKRLAQGVERYTLSGSVSVTVSAGTNPIVGSATISFSPAYATGPVVMATLVGTNPQNAAVMISNKTIGGATVNVARLQGAATTFTVDWVAVGKIVPPT
jgi:hypothetical protein